MAEDTEFELRTDIMPSEILLLADNWRESPDIEHDSLAKSIASVGLIHPPVIARDKKGHYIAIDGNRRTYVGQLLEKGYKTNLNGTPVILSLPHNWRVALIKKKYEELGKEEVDKLRLHSTEEHLHFSKMAKITQIWKTAQEFSSQRGLSLKAVRNNKILNEELIDHLSKYYQLDRRDTMQWLTNTRNYHKYVDAVIEPLHMKEIGRTIAKTLSSNVKSEDIPTLINLIKKHRKRGITETQQASAIIEAKKSDQDIKEAFETTVSKMKPIRTLSFVIPSEVYEMLEEEKKKQKKTWDEFLTPQFIANVNIYFDAS